MTEFFINISEWLGRSRLRYWGVLALTVVALGLLALRVHLSADISAFFPKTDPQADYVLSHLKAMDRVTLIFEGKEGSEADITTLADAAEDCADQLERAIGHSADISLFFGDEEMATTADMIFDHLPVLLTADEVGTIAQSLSADSVRRKMRGVAAAMRTPAGSFLAPIVSQDPLLFSAPVLQRLQDLRVGESVSVSDGYLTSADGKRLLLFVDSHSDFSDTGSGEALADSIESVTHRIEDAHEGIRVHAFGGPLVAVANSRCVTADERITLGVALALLSIVFFLVFGRVRSVLLLIVPVVFGALFAVGIIGALGLSLSVMAVGTGATVLGVALGYSIHVVTHGLHVESRRQLVRDVCWPLTVGSLTTVGAFVALLFTGSQILRDLGLFASLALIGTLIFCLVFLPSVMAFGHETAGPAHSFVQRIAGHDYSRSRILVVTIFLLFFVCLFFFTDVRFNPDMSTLGYKGDDRMIEAQKVLEETFDVGGHETQLVVCADGMEPLTQKAQNLTLRADSISKTSGLVHRATGLSPHFILTQDTVLARAARWRALWTPERIARLRQDIGDAGAECGFAPDAFDAFFASLTDPNILTPISLEEIEASPVFGEWLTVTPNTLMLYVSMETDLERRDDVLTTLASDGVVPTDMGFFARRMAKSIVDDFNWLLALSSAIVALALFVAYRRPELALMTFMPMAVGWVIILGLMALFDVEFNVVNIILSTFIFGVGDDFAIFIMDGLRADYSKREGILGSHKTAIALSAFAAIVGLGAQVFGHHPAVHSLGLISIFGLTAVIIISFVVQPVLFRIFISEPSRHGYPFTLSSLLRTIGIYLFFGIVCIAFQILGLLAFVIIHPAKVRRRALHQIVYWCMRLFVLIVRPRIAVPKDIDFENPSIIIANHLSMVDIVSLLSSSPRVVFVVKKWVSGSPIMGLVTRMLDFYCAGEGSAEEMISRMRQVTDEGYSIVIFPEGTRSADGVMQRFHKGAFVLAHELKLPLTPVVFYGNSHVISRNQPWHIMNGLMVARLLPTIPSEEVSSSTEFIRKVRQQMQDTLNEMTAQYDPQNPYFSEVERLKNLYRE